MNLHLLKGKRFKIGQSLHNQAGARRNRQALQKQVGALCGTPTKRQVSKRQVSKRPVSKRLKRQVYITSGLQNVRFTKCQVYKTSGLQNVRLQKNIHVYSVVVVGGNPQVLLHAAMFAGKVMSVFLYMIHSLL